jgi:hypothetical protein
VLDLEIAHLKRKLEEIEGIRSALLKSIAALESAAFSEKPESSSGSGESAFEMQPALLRDAIRKIFSGGRILTTSEMKKEIEHRYPNVIQGMGPRAVESALYKLKRRGEIKDHSLSPENETRWAKR